MRIKYLNKKSGVLTPALTITVSTDDNGDSLPQILVGGVDILSVMQSKIKKQGNSSPSVRKLKKFVRSNIGQALMELVPVLFVKLEQFDQADDRLLGLKIPLGLIRTSLELITGNYGGFNNADKVISKTKANKLRGACKKERCLFKTKQFNIDENGMFNLMSLPTKKLKQQTDNLSSTCDVKIMSLNNLESNSIPALPGSISSSCDVENNSFNTLASNSVPAPDECFGYCGLGCNIPFEVMTDQCFGHDTCVKDFGHTACIFDSHGDGYNSLLEAIFSYTVVLTARSVLAVHDIVQSTSIFTFGGDNYYSPSPGEFCSYDIYCIDRTTPGLPQDPF